MTILQEFEKAFEEQFPRRTGGILHASPDGYKAALWAAKWMAERCADEVLLSPLAKIVLAGEIRKLAKELSNEIGGGK